MKNSKDLLVSENVKDTARRRLLKQVVYAAPTVVIMGALMKPTKSEAAGHGKPPSGPTWS